MSGNLILSTVDIVIITLLLLVSAFIGLFFYIFGGKQNTNNDYLLAGKDMSIFPVSFSLMATFISVTTLMGIPTEMYLFGTNMAFLNLGFAMGAIIASILFLPIYFKTGVSTPFEYLEKRFGKTTRRILSVICLIQSILFCGISLYAPALALSAVTNISLWVSVICIAVVATLYSTIGGMKAVIWTNLFQAVLMYTCLIAIVIKGCLDLGGMENIFKIAYEGDRIILPTFKLNFSIRCTMWSIFLQGFIMVSSMYGANQVQVQRQLTLKNLKRSVMSNLLSVPMIIVFQLLCCLCGIIFYVYFQSCDPVISSNNPLTSYDQMMPYYIISTMREYPGLPGLCISGIFSVSLSSCSALINSAAAITYQDIIRPIWDGLKNEVLITKTANILYGVLTIFVTLFISTMGNLIKASILVIGLQTGPALGVFLLAALTTTANEMGINAGLLASFFFAGFVTFFPNARRYPTLPIQSNCSVASEIITNTTVALNEMSFHVNNNSGNSQIDTTSSPDQTDNFPISFMWITPFSLVICLVIGYFSSWIITCIQGTSRKIPTELLSPFRQRFCANDRSIQNSPPENNKPIYKIYTETSIL